MAVKLPDGRIMDDFGEITEAEIYVYGDEQIGTGSASNPSSAAEQDGGKGGGSNLSDLWINVGIGILALMILGIAFYSGFNS